MALLSAVAQFSLLALRGSGIFYCLDIVQSAFYGLKSAIVQP
jgi:hypothetical protein